MTDARRAQTHAMTVKLVEMGFNLEFQPRDATGFAREMLRTLRDVGAGRARMFAGAGAILDAAKAAHGDVAQASLFGGPPEIRLPKAKAWTPMEVLEFESDAMGHPVRDHILYQPLHNAYSLLGETD